jgi:hypothetical protein
MGNLMHRFGMASDYICIGTLKLSVVNSSLTTFTMDGTRNLAVFMLEVVLFISFWFCSQLLRLSQGHSWLLVLWLYYLPRLGSLASSLPPCRERESKPKRGPTYYSFLSRHPRPATPFASPHYPALPSVASPSTAQNWDENDWGPVFVEEEFPWFSPNLLFASSMETHVSAQNILVPSTQAGDESLPRCQKSIGVSCS